MKTQKLATALLSAALAFSLVPTWSLAEEGIPDVVEGQGALSEEADASTGDALPLDDVDNAAEVLVVSEEDAFPEDDAAELSPAAPDEAIQGENGESASEAEDNAAAAELTDVLAEAPEESVSDELAQGVVLTVQSSGSSTKSAMYSAYKAILEQAQAGKGVFSTTYQNCHAGRSARETNYWLNDLEYSLFDINADGTPELLVRSGFIAAYTVVDCFTFVNGEVIHMGKPGDLLWYANERGELYGAYMKMGASSVYQITANSSAVSRTQVFKYGGNDDMNYSKPRAFLESKGATALERSNGADYVLLWKVISSLTLSFSDVSAKTPHAEDILWLAEMGISTGWKKSNGTFEFRPANTVIRQDMAAFLFREAKLWGLVTDSWQPKGTITFTDVDETTPHYREIMWLAESGISYGWKMKDGTTQFRPTNVVVRQDMAAFLCRLEALRDPSVASWTPSGRSPFSDVVQVTPHYREILWLAQSGVSRGWTVSAGREFRPTNTVIRQDMAAFLHRLDEV